MKLSLFKKIGVLLAGFAAVQAFAIPAVYIETDYYAALGKKCEGCGAPLTDLKYEDGVVTGKDTRYIGFEKERIYQFDVFPIYPKSEFFFDLDENRSNVYYLAFDWNYVESHSVTECPTHVTICGRNNIESVYFEKNRTDGNSFFNFQNVFPKERNAIETFTAKATPDENGNIFFNVPSYYETLASGALGVKFVLRLAYFVQQLGDETSYTYYENDQVYFKLAGSNFNIASALSTETFISYDESGENRNTLDWSPIYESSPLYIQLPILGKSAVNFTLQQATGENVPDEEDWKDTETKQSLTMDQVQNGTLVTVKRTFSQISTEERHWFRFKIENANDGSIVEYSSPVSFTRYYKVNMYDDEKYLDYKYCPAGSQASSATEALAYENGISFVWYTSSNLSGTPYDFSTPVYGDLNLYVKRVPIEYEIVFLDLKGKVAKTEKLTWEQMPTAPDLTAKEDNDLFKYSIKWNPVISTVKQDEVYKSVLDSVLNDVNIYLSSSFVLGGDVDLLTKTECVSIEKINLLADGEVSVQYRQGQTASLERGVDYTLVFNVTISNNVACEDDLFYKSYQYNPNAYLYIDGVKILEYVSSYNYTFKFKISENEHNVQFVNVDGNLIKSTYVAENETPSAPSVKDDDILYHYIPKWNAELVPVTKDVVYTLVSVDRVFRDNSIDLTLANVADGEHAVLSSPSECIYSSVQQIMDMTNFSSVSATGDKDVLQEYTFVYGHNYLFAISVSVDMDNTECADDIFVKTLHYYNDDASVTVNGKFASAYLKLSNGFSTQSANITYTAGYAVQFFDGEVQVGETQVVASGEQAVEIDAPEADAGRSFVGWYLDNGDEYDFKSPVTSTVKLYAKWALNKYAVTVSVNDSKMGAVTGAGSYEYGAEITLVATALDGYKFSNWEDDAKAAATRKVTVTGEASYKANFEKIVVASSSSSSAKGSDVKPGSSSSVIPGSDPESSSAKVAASSSSVKPASSNSKTDAKSSSSKKASSSSSVKPGSSSNVKPSSSSSVIPGSSSSVIPGSDPESRNSSSSAKRNSSSSAKKDAIVASAKVPMFSVAVMGRSLQIAGAPVDAKIAVFDMQGGLVSTGRVDAANFNVAMPRSGSYMVRIGNQVQRVNVK